MAPRADFTVEDRQRVLRCYARDLPYPRIADVARATRIGGARLYKLLALLIEEHLLRHYPDQEGGRRGRYHPTEAGEMLAAASGPLPPPVPVTRQPLVLRLVGEDRDVVENAMERGGLTLREVVLLGARAVVEELRAREAPAPPAPPSMLGALGL